MASQSSVILITGCSSGLGRSLALESLARGMRVIATARRLDTIQELRAKGAQTFALDVTAPRDALRELIKETIGVFGQIDILVNNAGYVQAGAVEENTEDEIRAQFETHFFGVINLTTTLLPHFRERKTGTIVNISTAGAFIGISGAGIYCASKAALDCLGEVWSKELAPFNIRCVTISLGTFRTAAAGPNTKSPRSGEIEGYDAAHNFLRTFRGNSGKELGDPDKGARKLLDCISLNKPFPARLPIGEDAANNMGNVWRKREREWQEWRECVMGTNADGVEAEESWFA
ncbi:putative oxidoreductase,short chain dehydrogenase [Marasmius fiardii PR-910]|nr:putative oxidoreductase,short chain dehydrogenase [Marasmius fiardii PR-910]